MALRVWLPLNGNLNNQGLSTIVPSGTPTFLDNGKIGKCISLTPRVSFTGMPRMDNFTVLFGLKVDSCSVDGADSLSFTSIQADGSSAAPFRFEATKTSRACSFHNNTPYAITTGSRILITEAQKGEGHHCGFSYDGEHCYTYIDGVLTYTDTGLGGYINNYFHIGETNNMVGGMNDLRVYDECLSQKQIKEISKGLVAHYKLEGPGANPNLLLHADKYLKNSPRIKTGTGTDLYDTPGIYYNGLDTSKYYVYSMCCDGTLATAHGGTSTTDATKKYWTAGLYYQDTPYSDSSYSSYQTPVCYHANCSSDSNMYLGNIGNRYYGRVKPPYANCSVRINAYSNGTDSVSVKFGDFKLEEGTKLTTGLPNQADALYSTFGYNNMFAEDSSGNGYNGVVAGSLDYNSDAARYDGCTKFSDSSFIQINQPLNGEAKQVSFSFGFNMTGDAQNKYSAIFIPNGNPVAANGLWLSINTESVGLGAYRSSFKPNYHKAGALIETTGGHHAVFVGDAGVSKGYLDGSQYGSTVDTGATETLSSTLDYTIGDSYTGTNGSGTPFTGRLSDFRIYATALTADDILTLYKTSGIIDNKGNVYAYEFKEE